MTSVSYVIQVDGQSNEIQKKVEELWDPFTSQERKRDLIIPVIIRGSMSVNHRDRVIHSRL